MNLVVSRKKLLPGILLLLLVGLHHHASNAFSLTPNRRCLVRQQGVIRLFQSQESSCSDSTSGSSAVRSQRPTVQLLPNDYATTNSTTTPRQLLQMLSFYDFRPISDIETLRDEAFRSFSTQIPGLRGTLYVAHEGINGQFAVPIEDMEMFRTICQTVLHCDNNNLNLGDVVPLETPTFEKLIVRTRNAILRDGRNLQLHWNEAGDELAPGEWHKELQATTTSPRPLILDCRNDYESEQGSFANAIPLNTTTFSESWDTLDELSKTLVDNKDSPVYIFCTGGIRCVKVGAYMKQSLGFTNVKRLEHGIIGYQKWQSEQGAETPSLWNGENFLFDQRRLDDRGNGKNDGGNEEGTP